MPNPINKVVPKPQVYLDNSILADKPEMAILVTQIFATWARIEHELNFLLVRVLGATAAPALAMFATLTAQHLQLGALQAAAKAALSKDDFEIFLAAMSAAESAQTPRNHLAHWAWAGCKQRPGLLCLADPKMLRERDFRVAQRIHSAEDPSAVDPLEVKTLDLLDESGVLAYSKADLQRALRDLRAAHNILLGLSAYLDPKVVQHFVAAMGRKRPTGPEEIRAFVLRLLNGVRLFREALDRIRGGRQSTPPQPDGPLEPALGGS